MEESGIPKRNIILAAILALGTYMVWYYFLPKPQKITAPAPQAAMPAPAAIREVPAENHAFALGARQGSVYLDSGAPIAKLEISDPKSGETQPMLLPGSAFLGTRISDHPELRWQSVHDLVFELNFPEGQIQKEIIFSETNPGFGVLSLLLKSKTGKPQIIEVSAGAHLPGQDKAAVKPFSAYQGRKSLVVDFSSKKVKEAPLEMEGLPLEAAGVSGQYHLSLVYGLGKTESPAPLRREEESWVWSVNLENGRQLELPFYCGVKTEKALSQLGLGNMLYGGVLGPLKKFVRWTLAIFYRLTGNYGLAIILLTAASQVLLLPFTLKNLKFTNKMKELAPKIQQIQAKYKNDPKKMNEETMLLYRTYGANPLGGCLTMVLQMPIFFALYGAISDSYELYGAPFMFWIKNLAVHDPTYILPLLMGGAMLFQTMKTQSTIADPSQKMMMYVMPAMFTFMFLKFPSGLVLYWLTSNLISLGLNSVLPRFMEKIS